MRQRTKKAIAIIALQVAILIAIVCNRIDKPTIYIIREYDADSLQGPCKIVDYTINGYATSAVFYEYEVGFYDRFIDQLEIEGRVIR